MARTAEPEPREVRLPASFWNAKGRRRVALAYCRTIHKAQGATYRGESLTLAGDDTIHLEAVHVALSRATAANHLYHTGEPPPHEDHHAAELTRPEVEGLVATAARSRAQVMALDLLGESGAVEDRRRPRREWAAASHDAQPAAAQPAVAAQRRSRIGP